MKKVLIIMSFALLVVCFLFPKEKEIRIRIISNSNEEKDLVYKAEVVDYFKVNVLPNISLTKEFLSDNIKKIEAELQSQFKDVKVSFEPHTFTNKTYNDNAICNGSYDTLLIKIGSGEGDNWWASVYDGAINYESTEEIEYRWWIKELVGW